MQKKPKIGLAIFCIFLLFLCCTIRSGIIVDKSFIPRFFLLSLVLLIVWSAGRGRMIRAITNLTGIAMLCFCAWSFLSACWSIQYPEAILQSELVFLSLVLFLVSSYLAGKYPWFEKLFIRIHLLVLFFSFGLAFFKISLLEHYDPYRILSVSANNNLYSGFLLISLPLAISGFRIQQGIWKYLSMLAGILTLFFIIILQTRAAYIGTTAALLFSGILLCCRYRQSFTGKNVLHSILSLILLVAGVVIFTANLDNSRRQYFLQKIRIWSYFRSYDELQAGIIAKLQNPDPDDHTKIAPFDYSEKYYSNANLRVIFWKKSLGLVAMHPLLGVGAGNWRLAIASVKDPPNPEHTIGNYTYSEPHNEWIRIVAELGFPGLILALIIFILPVALVIRRIFLSFPKPPAEVVFYVSFITGFYLFAAFDFPFRRVEHNIVFWPVLAFMMNKIPVSDLSQHSFKKIHLNIFSALVVCLLVFSAVTAVLRFKGEYYTLKVFRNEHKNDSLVIKNCRYAENVFYHLTPNTLPVIWFEGVAHYRLGETDIAEQCFQNALKVTPYEVRVLNDYAAALFRKGDADNAIHLLNFALLIDPFFDDARFNLGAIFFLTGKHELAKQQILKCRESSRKTDFLKEMN